jgi:DNA-binding PadR family transcriptional regulator
VVELFYYGDLKVKKVNPQKLQDPLHITYQEELVLLLLKNNVLYGLQIIKIFKEIESTIFTPSYGTIYSLLAQLEEKEFIESYIDANFRGGGPCPRFNKITPKGLEALNRP